MALQVHFDSNGLEQTEFTDVRERLLRTGSPFTPGDLARIPYRQLPLCSMANARAAGCDLRAVRQEKADRRRRFVEMSPDELHGVERYLKAQGMYADVLRERERRTAPEWAPLSPMQMAWFRLTCIHNHTDDPHHRMYQVERLLVRAGESGLLSMQKACVLVDAMLQLLSCYPGQIDMDTFRTYVGDCAEEILQLMPDDEREACSREILRDYSCTSDCFQPSLAGGLS